MSSSECGEEGAGGGAGGGGDDGGGCSTACCSWLEADWLARAREDAARDAAAVSWPPRTLPSEVRSAAWRVCALLKATGEGTPALAARLLERYLAVSARNTLTTLAMIADKSGKNLSQLCQTAERRTLARLPLTLVSCVQVAGKMVGVNTALSAKRARLVLAAFDQHYPLHEVIASEHAVFALLGYRVPLWSSLEAAELLASRLRGGGGGGGAPSGRTVAACVRLGEMCRSTLEERVQWAGGTRGSGCEAVSDLVLAAGAALAAVRLHAAPAVRLHAATDAVADLAIMVEAPRALITCVADVIVTLALE